MSSKAPKGRNRRSSGKLVVLNEEELIRQVAMRPVLYDRSLKAYRKSGLRHQFWKEVSIAMDATVEECRRRWRSLRDAFAKHYKQTNRLPEDGGGGGGPVRRKKWVFYDQMSFIAPFLDSSGCDVDDHLLDDFADNSEDAQSLACEAAQLLQDNSTQELRQPMEVDANKCGDEDEHVQQTTVSVQATDFVPVSGDSPTMENHNAEYKRQHQDTSMSLQCAETNTDVLLDADEKFLLSCAPTLRRLTNRKNALARLKIQQILYDIEFGQLEN